MTTVDTVLLFGARDAIVTAAPACGGTPERRQGVPLEVIAKASFIRHLHTPGQ
jgi:hypothetical protein